MSSWHLLVATSPYIMRYENWYHLVLLGYHRAAEAVGTGMVQRWHIFVATRPVLNAVPRYQDWYIAGSICSEIFCRVFVNYGI